MILFYNNKLDDSAITATSQNAGFPVENLKNFIPSKVYKTGDTDLVEEIYFDFGTVTSITDLVIHNHNLSDVTALSISASAYSDYSSPVTVDLTDAISSNDTISFSLGLEADVRYWKLSFTKSDATDVKSIGRMFLGTSFVTAQTGNPDYDGYSIANVDLSISAASIGGQVYSEHKAQFRTLDLNFTGRGQSVKDSMDLVFKTVGSWKPYFIQVSDVSPLNEIMYVKNAKNSAFKISAWDDEPFWNYSISLEEQI